MARTPKPKDVVKVRRYGLKPGDEVLLRAKVRMVRDSRAFPNDPEAVLDIEGLIEFAPVRVHISRVVKPE